MNKYNGLLSKVSRQYHILRGTQETENEWKTRLVYSIFHLLEGHKAEDMSEV